jgi:hypothetical protein
MDLAIDYDPADYILRCKPGDQGFEVLYDGDEWDPVKKLPPFQLLDINVYWGTMEDGEFFERPLTDPPSEKAIENDSWQKYGRLRIYNPKHGEGIFRLAPSGVNHLKSFYARWKNRDANILGQVIEIGSRLVITKDKHKLNVPKFRLIHSEQTKKVVDAEVSDTLEAELDDVPF